MGWKGNNATFGRSWKWFGTLPKNCVSFPSPHEKLPFYFQPSRWIFQKKHSYDHSWTKLLVTYWFCYRTHASRMTFRTLTLAFGWNIMLRWNPLCKDLFSQFTILFSQYCNRPHVFHHRRHAKTNNKTFAFDKATHGLWNKQASHPNV